MAIRSRVVHPDTVIDRVDGEQMLAVSRDALLADVIAAVDTMLLVGGEFTVSSQRAPTGFTNESVSVAGFITWRNHSDAKPQPEPVVEPRTVEPDVSMDELEARDAMERGAVEFDEGYEDAALPTAVA